MAELLESIMTYQVVSTTIQHGPRSTMTAGERVYTEICETDIEPDEKDYIGEYTIGVNEVEILEPGSDDSVEIYDDSIEICFLNIPEKL